MKNCVVCNAEFNQSSNRQKYCKKCAKIVHDEQVRQARERYLIKKYSSIEIL